MLNLGNINFDDNAVVGAPLVLKNTNSLNAIGTQPAGTGIPLTPIVPVHTVATLPVASAALKGTVNAVSDATTPALGAALVGGGAVYCLALCTGAAWVAV